MLVMNLSNELGDVLSSPRLGSKSSSIPYLCVPCTFCHLVPLPYDIGAYL